MEPIMDLLLEVWQEACRHIEIGESTARVAPLLRRHLPVDLLIVRRIDLQRSSVDTVARGVCRDGLPVEQGRQTCTPDELERLLNWCRQEKVLRHPGPPSSPVAGLIVPPEIHADVLAGALTGEQGPVGLLLLVAYPPGSFEPQHIEVLKALLDPFAMALENDRRLREMETLRQAAEADKQALLTKLGRQDLSDMIVGAEAGLRQVMERVDLVARADLPVLIFGETGSGKEVVARAIHSRSARSTGPFLRVNCGAIPPDLIDSELFGHERGSFTGAAGLRKGWFERADGGTLFLDEVGELSPAAQVRLLRILQDGTFERVGGQQQLKVDVRVVAATHRDLRGMVADGRFREDLWYRIAVFPVHLPALRERPEDIPALATHLALRASRRFGLTPLIPSPADMNLLVSYAWPGNVRELAAVIDRAAILGNGRGLEIAKALGSPGDRMTPRSSEAIAPRQGLPTAVAGPAGELPGQVAGDRARSAGSFPTLEAVARRHIEAALTATQGRIEGPHGAARLLAINPHTLRARMRKLGIRWQDFRAIIVNGQQP